MNHAGIQNHSPSLNSPQGHPGYEPAHIGASDNNCINQKQLRNQSYTNVHVVMIGWNGEETQITDARLNLYQIFRNMYNFQISPFILPDNNAVAAAEAFWNGCRGQLTASDLLIVHYIGFSQSHPERGLEFFPGRGMEPGIEYPVYPSSHTQAKIDEQECDVLVLIATEEAIGAILAPALAPLQNGRRMEFVLGRSITNDFAMLLNNFYNEQQGCTTVGLYGEILRDVVETNQKSQQISQADRIFHQQSDAAPLYYNLSMEPGTTSILLKRKQGTGVPAQYVPPSHNLTREIPEQSKTQIPSTAQKASRIPKVSDISRVILSENEYNQHFPHHNVPGTFIQVLSRLWNVVDGVLYVAESVIGRLVRDREADETDESEAESSFSSDLSEDGD